MLDYSKATNRYEAIWLHKEKVDAIMTQYEMGCITEEECYNMIVANTTQMCIKVDEIER